MEDVKVFQVKQISAIGMNFYLSKAKDVNLKVGILNRDVSGMLVSYKAGDLVLFEPNKVQPNYYYSSFKEMESDANKCTIHKLSNDGDLTCCLVGVNLQYIAFEITND